MKILLISEGVLVNKEGKYFVKDTWINFPIYISEFVHEFVLLTCSLSKRDRISEDYKEIDLKNLKVFFLGNYNNFKGFYFQYFFMKKRWLNILNEHISNAEIVWIRLPSPALKLINHSKSIKKKKSALFFAGDIKNQSDLLIKYPYLNFLMLIFIKNLIKVEQLASNRASILYCYSSEISNRIKSNNSKKKLFRTPIISEKDLYPRKNFNLSEKIKILRVSWLLPTKGLEYLIRSIAELKKIGYNLELSIVGEAKDSKYKNLLNKLVIDLDLTNEVKFLGWKSKKDLDNYYINYDIHVISSLSEGTPRVILEGMSKAIPTICSKVGGVEDFLNHGIDSLLIEPGSEKSISNALIMLINDIDLRKRISINGFNSAKRWTIEKQAKNILGDMKLMLKKPD